MEIRNLATSSLEELVSCFTKAFADYSVPMPSDVKYWEKRLFGARFRKDLSFGAFDQGKLVGFIWNCMDQHHGKLSGYNTGTGVLPAYRGQKIVDALYESSLPVLKKEGVEVCSLEVIQTNARAIRVYERIGFKIKKDLFCVKGELSSFSDSSPTALTEYSFLPEHFLMYDHFYSWDNSNEALLLLKERDKTYMILDSSGEPQGYFSINRENGYMSQYHIENDQFDLLFSAVQKVRSSVQINNIDGVRTELLLFLKKHGFKTLISQYEMELAI